ncbi:uncharacterized protein LOC133550658 [Nerophis ophidion]|uniref:uncharacterized protein LOC133550658 n=1 Tax=Nerophis ophidion TaxID=159077 RepID=UPI002AE0865B|nr:uncharacterized protein LOC133550658 [Nerophis ophidion]
MDVIEKHGINIHNAVLIECDTTAEENEEVMTFLSKYGSIGQCEIIDDWESDFRHEWVIEYNSADAINALRHILPYTFVSQNGKISEIFELSAVCATSIEKQKTNAYLSDLKELAKLTGKDFTEVLNDVMSLLGHSVMQLGPVQTKTLPTSAAQATQSTPTASTESQELLSDRIEHKTHSKTRTSFPHIAAPTLNPPEVQRYVVEHIVKNEDSAMLHLSSQRLRVFSGRLPRPPNETYYETWRVTVDLMVNDSSISDLQRSRKIFESLLPPAADMVKHLKPETQPAVYLHILDSAYGTVQDGDELYAKFMDTFQDSNEMASSYLQRLQVALNLAVKRGGVLHEETKKHLLNQFCRGCWDNVVISELQLRQRKHNPPSFAELLLLLRTEEDRKAAKTLRMK